MQDRVQIDKINTFLSRVAPGIVKQLEAMLKSADLNVKREKSKHGLALSVERGDLETKFYLHNLLLEIATVDRDEEPLRFDTRLHDFEFFIKKSNETIVSKLRILFEVLYRDDLDEAIKNIEKLADRYERICIITKDPES